MKKNYNGNSLLYNNSSYKVSALNLHGSAVVNLHGVNDSVSGNSLLESWLGNWKGK